mmetsp:Transcript_20937/g.31732  ORF Transcript_20937/g.31732 Transcript_20937/m.31732 type:complete len:288 (-) Transcript_20937:1513-2376(-)
MTSKNSTLIFQDLITKEIEGDDESLSLAFFELANVSVVGYRLSPEQCRKKKYSTSICVKQDLSACGNHTGGIVWETSYLLLNYLLQLQGKMGRVLEVGAGCGLLGQVLASSGWTKSVAMTETDEVLPNLHFNLKQNPTIVRKCSAHKLDWLDYKRDAVNELRKHSFDTLVGTDVVFSPCLVEPLLKTLKYMSHRDSVVYLCLQIRCEDSHKLLLEKADSFSWKLQDISQELAGKSDCSWGLEMGCCLLKLTPVTSKIINANLLNEQTCKKRRKTSHEYNIKSKIRKM